MVSLGGRATVDTGLLGTIHFRTSTIFSGTTIRLAGAELIRGGQSERVAVNVDVALQPGPSPDFDGDGVVGFADFVQFADKFGSTQGNEKYEERFDLDGDGSVGTSDFLELSAQFGKKVPTPLPADGIMLVALYNATDGDYWADNTNWLDNNDLSAWHGVTVVNGRVTELDLENNYLRGAFPSELGKLENLTVLNLSNNALIGPIPPELGKLQKLTVLGLENNALSGPIPPELGDLDSLSILKLHDNQLIGSIPPELGGLENLMALGLDNNRLSGPIPVELSKLGNLRQLSLYTNELSGPIPPELGNLTNLAVLDLDRNQVSGPIPPELGKLKGLRWLILDSNQLSGPIPPELGNLENLTWLRISDNPSLTGALPQSLTGLTELRELYFDGTGLCAPLDAAFQRWLRGIGETRGSNCP